jgi:Spy/CpxP family protein refolding chaperone
MMTKRIVVVAALAAALFGAAATPALADQPGPGDKQCVPGQQGNPHPAHKAGVCKK